VTVCACQSREPSTVFKNIFKHIQNAVFGHEKAAQGEESHLSGFHATLISVLSTFILPIAEDARFPVVDGLIQRVQIIIGWAWLALTIV